MAHPFPIWHPGGDRGLDRVRSDRLGIGWQTAKQKLYALADGGIAIKQERFGGDSFPRLQEESHGS